MLALIPTTVQSLATWAWRYHETAALANRLSEHEGAGIDLIDRIHGIAAGLRRKETTPWCIRSHLGVAQPLPMSSCSWLSSFPFAHTYQDVALCSKPSQFPGFLRIISHGIRRRLSQLSSSCCVYISWTISSPPLNYLFHDVDVGAALPSLHTVLAK